LPEGPLAERRSWNWRTSDLLAALNASWPGPSCELPADVAKDITEQILHALWAAC
jgi:hypothetical protein